MGSPAESKMRAARGALRILLAASLGGCGGDATGPSGPAASCRSIAPTVLAVGAHSVIDPAAAAGCLLLPAAGAAGAEYLVVAVSTTAQVTIAGISAPYKLSGEAGGLVASVATGPQASRTVVSPSPAERFHDMLRARGHTLSRNAALSLSAAPPPSRAVAPAPVGSQRSFEVCGDTDCSSFVTVNATVKYAGPHSLLYLDDSSPSGGYSQADLDGLGSLFDRYMYPIDTTAFGRETDLDGNSAVVILLSPAVNRLSGNCNTTNSVILGFFFPDDLLPGSPGSNSGEIFYSLVPDPANQSCTISRSFALAGIGPTFLHEFQHMISFGRHVVLAHGAAEDNWLDEGLSRLAEELGGREIPDSVCAPSTCLAAYPHEDLANAFSYLQKNTLEASPLIEPGNVDGTLAEAGANWLFVRWLADHFATDSVLGTSLTRKLDGADSPGGVALTGAPNASAVTGVDFSTLIAEWQMANYLTAVSGVADPTARLRYRSWNLDSAFTSGFGGYPLVPDSLSTGTYTHTGVLQAGSGRHVRVIQAGSAPAVAIDLTSSAGGSVSALVAARFGVTRVR